MRLNLLTDAWIPAVKHGKYINLRPDQIAEPGVFRLAWPRADCNLACLELLIELVSMVDPPANETDWFSRLEQPDPERLRAVLLPFAPYFELSGDGPRFMQDLETFETVERRRSDVKPVDMLFVDSAAAKTVRLNADMAVKRNRHDTLSPGEAAIALYTLFLMGHPLSQFGKGFSQHLINFQKGHPSRIDIFLRESQRTPPAASAGIRQRGSLDTGGSRGHGEGFVQCGERQPHAHREFQISGVVDGQMESIRKRKHRFPNAQCRNRLNFDGKSVQACAN